MSKWKSTEVTGAPMTEDYDQQSGPPMHAPAGHYGTTRRATLATATGLRAHAAFGAIAVISSRR
jgi:hypothetical protein